MMEVFTRANEALFAVHGTVFLVGNTHDILYPNSGSARDWCKGVASVKYTTGIELRDEGQFGFLLPEDQGSTCRGVWRLTNDRGLIRIGGFKSKCCLCKTKTS